ncbi:hypothetical protein B0J14DRAFT_565980 [Halenospora varia]|nr:hypothetical protein B0J14DRAFT_565980 [Halenospora varia]
MALVKRFPPTMSSKTVAVIGGAETWPIFCNGDPVMLSRLGEQGFLWIDRICIDQDNNHEKSNQLGRHGTDSAPAMQVQNNFAGPSYDLSEQGELTEEDLQKHTPGDPGSHVDYHCAFLAKFGLDITMTATWFDWCQFFRRTWFYRSWTLQETSLARDIHVLCGNHQFNWYKLKFLVKYFQNSGWDSYLKALLGVEIDNLPRRAFYAREIAVPGLLGVELWKEELIRAYGVSSSGSSLTEFLYRNSMLQCSEPRDIVFALLSIPKGTNQPSHLATINVDYTSNTNANYIGVPSNEIKMGDPIWLIVRTKIFPRAKYGQSSDCCMAKIKSLLEQCI